VSSDAALNSPRTLLEQIRTCFTDHSFPLEQVLPLVTSNTARTLKLQTKGRLEVGHDADLLVMKKESLELRALVARGRLIVLDGQLCAAEAFSRESNRRVRFDGQKE
jgi:beta-aspartyl-dipeptidase (metallo-type)